MIGIYNDGTSFNVNTGYEMVWIDNPLIEDEYFLTWYSVYPDYDQYIYIDGVKQDFRTCGTGPSNYLGMSSYVPVRFGSGCVVMRIWGNYPSVISSMFKGIIYNFYEVNLYNATTVGRDAFAKCCRLSRVNLPKVISVGRYAFEACEGLTSLNSVNFENLEYIAPDAFWNCYNISYIDLPNLLEFSGAAFHGCTGLKSFNAPKLRRVNDGYGLGYWAHISNLSYINVPSLEEVPYGMCESLPLTSISLPAASIIGSEAFAYCRQLRLVELGDCQQIRTSAFRGCNALNTLYIRGSYIPELWEDALLGTDVYAGYGSIYVQSSMVTAFKIAAGWSLVSNTIYPIPS